MSSQDLFDSFEPPGYVHATTIKDVDGPLKFFTFPDDFSCYSHTSVWETELIYNEIFVKQEYLLHGLSLEDCRCVFDVGANIGLFTVFIKSRNEDLVVHAFEPIRHNYDTLLRNIELHKLRGVYPHNNALGSTDGAERTFTFYPNMAGNSTANPGDKAELQSTMTELFGKELVDFSFQSEIQTAQVRTISSMIEKEGVSTIDLLKIDVEGDELAVLKGISEDHFRLVRQVVAEVHSESLLKETQSLLGKMGFTVLSDTGISAVSGVCNIYGVRL